MDRPGRAVLVLRKVVGAGPAIQRRSVIRRRALVAEASHEVERLMAAGEALADEGLHAEALATFGQAWQALPEPKDEQEWAVNVLAAVGDCSFFLGRWD